MNFKIISYILGWVIRIEGFCLLLPLICAAIYKETQSFNVFLACIVSFILLGTALSFKRPEKKTMFAKEGFVTVALSWIVISILGSIPFMATGYIKSFIDALFETVSGFTTTGASILTDVEILPKSLLLWRSFTHWLGGMGVLVFVMAILPMTGSEDIFLMKAESPGPNVSKFSPRVTSTAKVLYLIYIALTILEILLLLAGDMDLFSAVTMSFGTAGTGGFSILNSGQATYTSYQQIVITVFMLLFGVDFSFYYLLLIRKFKSVLKMEEVRSYFIIIISSIIVIGINCRGLFANFGELLKHSAFQVASIITTTGYSTVDFDLWPSFSKTVLVILMFIGACAGSTGGGMKISRILVLLKSIVKQIKISVHPKNKLIIKMNGQLVEHETIRGINVYTVSYFVILFLSALLISVDNYDFTTNFTSALSTLSNIGPGLAKVGPTCNFSIFSPFSTFVLTVNMLIGRLEIFPILVLFSPYTWKK